MAYFTPLQLLFFVLAFVFFVGALYRAYRSKSESSLSLPHPIMTVGAGAMSSSVTDSGLEEAGDGGAPVVDAALPPEWFPAPVTRVEEERPKVRPALLVKTERVAQFQFRSAVRPPRASSE
jgi:hypothetical protein